MIRVFLSLILVPCTVCMPGLLQAQDAPVDPDTVVVSLQEATERALDVSPEINVRRAERAFARARREEALASRFLTEFTLTTGHSVVPGLTPSPFMENALYLDPTLRNDWDEWHPYNQAEVTLTQPIYTFGELSESIEAATYGVAVEDARVEQKKLGISLRTGELYYSLLLAKELYRLAQETGSIIDRAKEEIQRLLQEGAEDVDNADLFQVQLTEQEYIRRLAEVTQKRIIARSALKRQLFLPEEITLRLADESLQPLEFQPESLDTYIAVALQRRPQLRQARAGVAARQALVEVAQSEYYPKLFFRGTAGIRYAPGRPRIPNPYISDPYRGRSLTAGIGFRLNLNFWQTEARVDQAKAELNQVRYQREAAEQLVRFEVEQAYRQFKIAEAALEAQEKALAISKEWLGLERVNFEFDLGDTENLVEAVRARLEHEVAYYRAVYDYNMAILRLLDATGTLTDRITDDFPLEG